MPLRGLLWRVSIKVMHAALDRVKVDRYHHPLPRTERSFFIAQIPIATSWALNVMGRKGKNMKTNWRLMAEDDGAAGGGATPPDGGDGGTNGGDGDNKPMTFDEMLASNPEYQKEFDRRTTKGINTAVTKERDRLNKLHNDQLTEQQRLANMTEDEKRAYQDQKREKELADREAKITRRELEAEAKNILADKGLPVAFAGLLDYSNADTVKSSIEAIEKEWAPAIESTVEDRLKGGKPPKDASTESNSKGDIKLNEVRGFMKQF